MSTIEPLDDETERRVLHAAIYLVSQQDRPEAEWSPRPEGITGLHIAIARGRMSARRPRTANAVEAHRKLLRTAIPASNASTRCACCGVVYGYGCMVGDCILAAEIPAEQQHDAGRYIAEQAHWLDEVVAPAPIAPRRSTIPAARPVPKSLLRIIAEFCGWRK